MDKKELVELILSALELPDDVIPYECTVRAAARVLQKTKNTVLPQVYELNRQYGLRWEVDGKSLDILFLDSWRANVKFIINDEVKVEDNNSVFGMNIPDYVMSILNEYFNSQQDNNTRDKLQNPS